MVWFMITAGLLALLGAVPFLLRFYLERLPAAPDCPTCGAVTRTAEHVWLGSFVLAALTTTAVQECTLCDWRGRMRWRWAARRVRGKRQP